MLRRLDVEGRWRSLDKDSWPNDMPLGRRTVIYGHNGSGKSTLSELLLGIADGHSVTGVVWEDENRTRRAIALGDGDPDFVPAVYTRKWVQENLSDFLDGDTASAIVTLGRDAIKATEEQGELEEEIERLQAALPDAETTLQTAKDEIEVTARGVQERIVFDLQEFDYKHFTKNRYSLPRVKDDLRRFEGEYPDAATYAEALKRLGEKSPSLLPEIPVPPTMASSGLHALRGLLADTPTRGALAEFEGKPTAESWAERGRELHEKLEFCLFCTGRISTKRRDQLARHFDESWLQIRADAKVRLAAVGEDKRVLEGWRDSLPEPEDLGSHLRSDYNDAREQARLDVNSRVEALSAIEAVLEAKVADPSSTPEQPDWSVLGDAPSAAALTQAVNEHNEQARQLEAVAKKRQKTVFDHLVGSRSQVFRDLEEAEKDAQRDSSDKQRSAEEAERRLGQLRQARFATKPMADTLTRDLARVYGKDHLTIAVTNDGKSYACRRGEGPGTNLSLGERTTLSLLYFLRRLEDERLPGGKRSRRIVVIDDPSSSLDRESLFATHQWLVDTLQDMGQYVVLTHDFDLLRLFVQSQKGAWTRSSKPIGDKSAGEPQFPEVEFMEMYVELQEGSRATRIGRLPLLLQNSTSEYAYLFSTVMAGIKDPDEYQRLFLLPNAARRVLEVFASYKAPHLPNFLQQLEELGRKGDEQPFRDVYDFCNRFSHGEGSESIDVLDARLVHKQIRRCMEFLEASDPEHFERMCKATGTDGAALG
ncbi:MAG: AAA family ATPase [bacterium]|nr:AAA family ATPase [bacterium]